MSSISNLELVPLSQRPDLIAHAFEPCFQELWPRFMAFNENASLYFAPWAFENYLDFAYIAIYEGAIVARAFTIPFDSTVNGRRELPNGGWDQLIRWGHEDTQLGRKRDTLCALDITVLPKYQGKGIAYQIIKELKKVVINKKYKGIVVPLRPSQKHLYPNMPFEDYVNQTANDGYPVDPWIRTHIRAGGLVVKVASYSMTVVGTIDQWEEWAKINIRSSGAVIVAGALNPLLVSLDHGSAVYVEPNLWIRYIT